LDATCEVESKARTQTYVTERMATLVTKFEAAMAAQPGLRVKKLPPEAADWYAGQAHLKVIQGFVDLLDQYDTSPQQAARRARFEREKAAQQGLVDAADRAAEAQAQREAAKEAAEEARSASRGGALSGDAGKCSRPLSGPFGALVINGRALTCDTLIYQCQVQRPSDVGYCISSTLGPAGISGDACFSCWR
jgi:hypothetical protein